jgi:hypothetical protein
MCEKLRVLLIRTLVLQQRFPGNYYLGGDRCHGCNKAVLHMSKIHYALILRFLTIGFVASTIEFLLQFFGGDRIILYEIYPAWYAVMSIIQFAVLILLLQYYWYQRWRFVTIAATPGLIAHVACSIIFFSMLEFRKLGAFYMPGLLAVAPTTHIISATRCSTHRACGIGCLRSKSSNRRS